MDIRSLVRASYDPRRFSTAYHSEKRALKQSLAESAAAQGAPFGSIAAANDPNKYGSAAKQRFSNVFGRVDQNAARPKTTAMAGRPEQQLGGLRREAPGAPTAYEEMMGGRSFGPTIMAPPWLAGQERPNMLSRDAYRPFTGYTQNANTRSFRTNLRRPGGV